MGIARSLRWLCVLGSIAAGGCDLLDLDEDDVRDRLRAAQRRWTAQGYTDYEYRLTRSCYCLDEYVRPYIVRVDDGVPVDVRDAETGAPPPEFYPVMTIDDLFRLIDNAIDRDAYRLVVQYHATLGYPTSISIDYDRRVADEELAVRAEDLVPLR